MKALDIYNNNPACLLLIEKKEQSCLLVDVVMDFGKSKSN
jgi:hypothetical protein